MLKRKRPVNSCLPCRNRRLKCDKEHPSCGRCLSTNQECTYDGTASSGTAQGSRRTSTTARPLHNGTESNSLSTELRKPSTSEDQGKLVYARGGRAFYNGATFWGNAILAEDMISTAEDVNGVGTLRPDTQLDDDSLSWIHGPFRPPSNSGLKIPSSAPSHCSLCGRGYRIACVQQMLPSPDVCSKLCNIFFNTIFPLAPILHLQGLRQDLDEFWAALNERRTCPEGNVPPIIRRKPGLLCLFFAILFSTIHCTANETLDEVLGQDRPKTLLMTTYLATMISANLTGFPRRPSLYTLAAYVFVQSQFNREEEFHVAPEFISMAFRLSISMGLHRELHNANFSVSDEETRKRLWWYIVHLDVMASASSGLSPIFADEKMSNVGMIKEYDEKSTPSSAASKKRDIRYIIATKRYETTKEIRTILRLHFEDAYDLDSCREETSSRLERLAKNINRSCNSLLDLCASCAYTGTADAQQISDSPKSSQVWSIEPGRNCETVATNFARWGVILLHMMLHKAYCTFYHPLFSQDLSGASDSGVRDNAVKHSQAFLHLFVRLCTDATSKPYHWMYPGTYQPLQAVSLLIADLLHRPHSDEAETSRGLIDRLFEMYSVDHGIINKAEPARRDLSAVGRSAWKMLVRARRKALELMGEDAHLLIPSTPEGTTTDKCVCGERIAFSADYVPARENTVQGQHQEPIQEFGEEHFMPSEQSSSGSERTETQNQSSGVHSLWSDTDDFDWHEFEALAGISSGFVS